MGIRPYVKSPDWSEEHHRGAAKCRGYLYDRDGNDLFFDDPDTAMAICNGDLDGVVCPRRTECLRIAMINKENFGVWGGMTPHARLRLRMRYPAAPERWTWRPEPQAPASSDEDGGTAWPAAA